MAKTRRMPRPFKYRGGWRAQVTLSNGKRPHADFDTMEEAKQWIAESLAEDTPHSPELEGPTQATLAAALNFYASQHTIAKDGYESELTRINHYLEGAQMPLLRCEESAEGQRKLVNYEPSKLPSGWRAHLERRRALRAKTYDAIHTLARKTCSQVKPADIRSLMTVMKSDGLSASTIQKEIALLRHMFNVAASEWSWEGFKNPTDGFKLGKSNARFVFLTPEQTQALWLALAECDNPYFWPLVGCSIASTMRKKSLLEMTWDKTDLDGRVAQVPTKTGTRVLPLPQPVVAILRGLERDASGRVFPMSKNAVDMAWDGVRIKAGVPNLQFRDLRHLGATEYARRGLSAHQLKAVLGHQTLYMAEVYVNLVQQDVLKALDAATADSPIIEVPPPTNGSDGQAMNGKRSERLVRAVKERLQARAKSTGDAQPADEQVDTASSPASHPQAQPMGSDANAPADAECLPREDSAPSATVIPFAKRVA
jgi:integrase